jgi:hypothetical protein
VGSEMCIRDRWNGVAHLEFGMILGTYSGWLLKVPGTCWIRKVKLLLVESI